MKFRFFRPFMFSALVTLAVGLSACARKSSSREGKEDAKDTVAPDKRALESTTGPALPNSQPPASVDAGVRTNPIPPGIRLVLGPELKKQIQNSGAAATLVNVWASWCGPCRREFPMLQQVGEKLAKSNVELRFVTVDDPSGYADALKFAKEHGLKEPILAAQRPLGPFKKAMSPNWPGMLPATFLFDDSGSLRYFWPGEVFETELTPIVEGLLAGEEISGYAKVGLQRGIDTRY